MVQNLLPEETNLENVVSLEKITNIVKQFFPDGVKNAK